MQSREKTMTGKNIKRVVSLPVWRVSPDGKKKNLGGRWNMQRIEEILIESRNKKFSMDDLARLVYGSTSLLYRDRVRKHIPAQRNHMMAKLVPFVTSYGARGRIEAIKLYDSNETDDRERLSSELERLRFRNEISVERYTKLRDVLSLPPPLAAE
jgi:hypothetical protein